MRIIPFTRKPLEDTEWKPIAPEKVISGTCRSTYKILFSNHTHEMYAGIWESSGGKWQVNYAEDEFCSLLEGEVVLTPEDTGTPQVFKAPDSFVIESGFKGTWESIGKVRKYFVIYEKAAS